MKKSGLIKIIIFSFIAIVLTVILIISLVGDGFVMFGGLFKNISGFSYTDSELYSIGDTSIDTNGITELNVNWIAGGVNISTYNGSNISVSESCSSQLSDEEKLHYLVKDGVLRINYSAPFSFLRFKFSTPTKKLTVYIPESNKDLLNRLKVDSVSASVNIDKISADNMIFESVSGSIDVSPSGSSNSITVESVSGKINIVAITDSVDFETVSGGINFSGEAKKIDCESVSGKIELASNIFPNNVKTETVSGRTTLSIPDGKGFTARHSSVSGNFNCSFATTRSKSKDVYGDGSSDFDFESVSGSITIEKR